MTEHIKHFFSSNSFILVSVFLNLTSENLHYVKTSKFSLYIRLNFLHYMLSINGFQNLAQNTSYWKYFTKGVVDTVGSDNRPELKQDPGSRIQDLWKRQHENTALGLMKTWVVKSLSFPSTSALKDPQGLARKNSRNCYK